MHIVKKMLTLPIIHFCRSKQIGKTKCPTSRLNLSSLWTCREFAPFGMMTVSELLHCRVLLGDFNHARKWLVCDTPHNSCPGASVIVCKYSSNIYYLIKTWKSFNANLVEVVWASNIVHGLHSTLPMPICLQSGCHVNTNVDFKNLSTMPLEQRPGFEKVATL